MITEEFTTDGEDETIHLGSVFAEKLKPGDIVALYGELGTGKTEFIKGICNYFKVEEIVNSPTFTIINQYFGEYKHKSLEIYHLDLYRIKSISELNEIGFIECINSDDSIKLIEWADKANGCLTAQQFNVRIFQYKMSEDKRLFKIEKI